MLLLGLARPRPTGGGSPLYCGGPHGRRTAIQLMRRGGMSERVWERFLTESDRAHLAASKRYPVSFGTRPALLLIDLYYAVFGDEPQPLVEAIRDWPSSCGPAAWAALPHLQRLLAAAREAGIPVIHVHQNSCEVPVNWFE